MNELKIYARALETPILVETESGSKWCELDVRAYETGDTFRFLCYKELAQEVCQNIKKGQRFILKGHLSANNSYDEKVGVIYRPLLVADNIYYVN